MPLGTTGRTTSSYRADRPGLPQPVPLRRRHHGNGAVVRRSTSAVDDRCDRSTGGRRGLRLILPAPPGRFRRSPSGAPSTHSGLIGCSAARNGRRAGISSSGRCTRGPHARHVGKLQRSVDLVSVASDDCQRRRARSVAGIVRCLRSSRPSNYELWPRAVPPPVVLAALLVLGLAEATRSDTLGLGEAEPLAALLLLLAGLLSWLNALALTSVRLRRLRWCGVLVGVVGVVLSMTAAVTRSPARETVFAAAEKLTIVVIIAACVLVAVRR